MNQAEFHRAVSAFANGRHCATEIEVTEYAGGRLDIEYKAYVAGPGWFHGQSGPAVLASMAGTPLAPVDALDTLPAPAPLPPEVAPSPTLPPETF